MGPRWPGDFKIVLHTKPLTWDAAEAVPHPKTGLPWLRIDMRGRRPLGALNRLRFKYQLQGAESIDVELFDRTSRQSIKTQAPKLTRGQWAQVSVDFKLDKSASARHADEIRLLLKRGAKLQVDDLLLYEPGR